MAKNTPKDMITDYDKGTDALVIHREGARSSGSIELGDIIIDLDQKGEVVGLEFLQAAKQLTSLFSQPISKQMLEKITSCAMKTKHVGKNVFVTIELAMAGHQFEETVIPVPIIEQRLIEAEA